MESKPDQGRQPGAPPGAPPAQLRPVTPEDIDCFAERGSLPVLPPPPDGPDSPPTVSISEQDLANGSPRLGDMIARNPQNHLDQWLVARKYFLVHFP